MSPKQKYTFNYVISLLLILSYLNTFCQTRIETEVPTWVRLNEEDKYVNCCFYQKGKLDKVTLANFEKKKEQLKNNLLQSISESIQTSIKKQDILETKQTQDKNSTDFLTSFTSKTNISTGVILSAFEFQYWPKEYRKDAKYIIGYIKVDKSVLEDQYDKIIKKDLELLDGELSESVYSINSNLNELVDRINEKISNLEKGLNILSAVGTRNDYTYYYLRFVELKKKKVILLDKLYGKDYENKYRDANRLLSEKKCNSAYSILQELLVTNPADERVRDDKDMALSCIESNLLFRLTFFENKGEYEAALVVLDSLFWLSPAYTKMMEKRRLRIIDDYFDNKFRQISNVIETNVEEARKIHASINFYGSEKYRNKYEDYGNIISKKNKKILLDRFYYYTDKHLYSDAARILVKLSTEYGLSKDISDDIRDLNSMLESSIYKYEKKRLLSFRPHLYCIKLGYNYQSNPLNFNTQYYTFSNINYFLPYYTFEFYRKFNRVEKFTKNGRDRSTANMIGLRLGYLNNSEAKIVFNHSDSINMPRLEHVEVQISGIWLNFFHASYGLVHPISSIDKINHRTFIYTTNLGIKLRIWLFDVNANLRYNSDYKSPGNLFFETGLGLNINFKKKFNAEDRRYLKVKIQEWKK